MPRAMDLHDAIANRRSVRGFRPDPVPRETLERILAEAQRAPSWCNIQPWRVWVATGAARDRFIRAQMTAFETGAPHPDLPFPAEYPEPYDRHRKECGHENGRAVSESTKHVGKRSGWRGGTPSNRGVRGLTDTVSTQSLLREFPRDWCGNRKQEEGASGEG